MEAYGRRRRQEKRRPRAQTARAEDSTYAADESPLEASLAREIASDPGHPFDRIDENEREERIEAKPSTESSIEPEARRRDRRRQTLPPNTQKQAREKRRTGFLAFKKLAERVRHKRAEAREREKSEGAGEGCGGGSAPKDAEADRRAESERLVEEEDRVEAEPEETAPTPVKEDTKPEDTTPDAPVKEEETPSRVTKRRRNQSRPRRMIQRT